MEFSAGAGQASGQGQNAPVQTGIEHGLPKVTKDIVVIGTTEITVTAGATSGFNYVIFTLADFASLIPGMLINYQTYCIDSVTFNINPYPSGQPNEEPTAGLLTYGIVPFTRNFSVANGTFGSQTPQTLPGSKWHIYSRADESKASSVANQQFLSCTVQPQFYLLARSGTGFNGGTYASNSVTIYDDQGISTNQWRGIIQQLNVAATSSADRTYTFNVIEKFTVTFEGTRLLNAIPTVMLRDILGSDNMGNIDPQALMYRPPASFGFTSGNPFIRSARERQGESTSLSCSPTPQKECEKELYCQQARESHERYLAETSGKKGRRYMGNGSQAMDAILERQGPRFHSPGHAKGSIQSAQYKKRKQQESDENRGNQRCCNSRNQSKRPAVEISINEAPNIRHDGTQTSPQLQH